MGKQITPPEIGTEVGVRSDLKRGHPQARELSSQVAQMKSGGAPQGNKAVKVKMTDKSHHSGGEK